ncbi:MAG: 3'(2'),5'-bisphosphate nucleotidase CysQ [Nocardioidaceae bacterium]
MFTEPWAMTGPTPGRDLTAAPDDHIAAADAAAQAGRLLVELRHNLTADGSGAEALRRQGDRRSNDLLADILSSRFPDDAILSEEAADHPARLGHSRVWIVDPLDGTREFGELGRVDWAVHVALVVDGAPAAGAVCLPARGITMSTAPRPRPRPQRHGPVRMLVSRTRPAGFVAALAERLDATVVPMGSAGAKAMAVVLGEGEIFVHAGGQYEWDTAAPVAVATAAGLHASRIDGSPLRYNQPVPWLPDLLICTQELASPALAALSELAHGEAAAGPSGERR